MNVWWVASVRLPVLGTGTWRCECVRVVGYHAVLGTGWQCECVGYHGVSTSVGVNRMVVQGTYTEEVKCFYVQESMQAP